MISLWLFVLAISKSLGDKYIIGITLRGTTLYDGTEDDIYLGLRGNLGELTEFRLTKGLERGRTNNYEFEGRDVGIICAVSIRHNGTDNFYVTQVYVINDVTGQGRRFIFNTDFIDGVPSLRYYNVSGGWSKWSYWHRCDATCISFASYFRHRTCTEPRPGCGGSNCTGIAMEFKHCLGLNCSSFIFKNDTQSYNVSKSLLYVRNQSIKRNGLPSPNRKTSTVTVQSIIEVEIKQYFTNTMLEIVNFIDSSLKVSSTSRKYSEIVTWAILGFLGLLNIFSLLYLSKLINKWRMSVGHAPYIEIRKKPPIAQEAGDTAIAGHSCLGHPAFGHEPPRYEA